MGTGSDIGDLIGLVQHELSRALLGQQQSVELVLAAVITGGHVLLEDQPGVGKTTFARAIATVLGLDMKRVQGTTDLLPTDITGVQVYDQHSGQWTFRPGPVLASMLLVDELNRATPKAQSALLEAMAEGQVTVDGTTFPTPHPHVVIATQNPVGDAGTHRLVHAQLDRFAISVRFGLPGRSAERQLLDRAGSHSVARLATPTDLLEMRNLAFSTTVSAGVKDHVLELVDELRAMSPDVWLSTRVPLVIVDVARGLAVIDGRDYVAPDDIRAALPAVITHRLPAHISWDAASNVVDTVAVPS